jgi:hypothetical protein
MKNNNTSLLPGTEIEGIAITFQKSLATSEKEWLFKVMSKEDLTLDCMQAERLLNLFATTT